jgi:uncharacterized membrane protein
MDLSDKETDEFLFKGLVIVLIVVLALLLAYSYLNLKPETFTQVYLIPDKIVSEAFVGEKIPVEFEIDNREGKTVEYNYKISFKEKVLAEKAVSVENNEKKRIIEQISFSEATEKKEKVLIEVFKEGEKEPYSIWFWIEVYPGVSYNTK